MAKKKETEKQNIQKPAQNASATDSDKVILDMLSPNKSIDLKIEDALSELPENFTIILTMPRAQHELRYLRLVKHFTDKGMPGVYITTNKSTKELIEEMTTQKINSKKIIFVDTVTKMTGGEEISTDSVSYLENPDDITELNFESEHAINNLSKEKGFVILDSITTLLVYNKRITVEKFIHMLAQKIKNLKLQGIFLTAESTDKETLDTIAQFCDDIRSI